MHRIFVLALALAIPAGWTLAGEEEPPPGAQEGGLQERIAALVAALGSDSWQAREEATQKLVEIGAPALPAVEEASRSGDPEVRMRALAVVDKIRRAQALEAGGGDNVGKRALAWLAAHQNEDGLWSCRNFAAHCRTGACDGAGSSDDYDTGVTALSALAFLWSGHTPVKGDRKESVRKALAALVDRQTPDGCVGVKNADGHWIYGHAMATLALVEAITGTEKAAVFEAPARKAVDFLLQCQNPFLGWRYGMRPGENDTSITGWATLALSCARDAGLKVPQESFDGTLRWFAKVTDDTYYKTGYTSKGDTGARLQEAMGKFEPSEAMTALAVACRMRILGSAGLSTDEVRGGLKLLKKCPPLWSQEKGTIDMYYWFWGAVAMACTGQSTEGSWVPGLEKALLPNASVSGCALGSWDPVGAWGTAGGRVYSTAINLMSLRARDRFRRE